MSHYKERKTYECSLCRKAYIKAEYISIATPGVCSDYCRSCRPHAEQAADWDRIWRQLGEDR